MGNLLEEEEEYLSEHEMFKIIKCLAKVVKMIFSKKRKRDHCTVTRFVSDADQKKKSEEDP